MNIESIPPPGFVHIDLDGLWTVAACYGFTQADAFERDPVFETALPRLLNLLEEAGIRATFFITGRDTDHPAKSRQIGDIAARGHELANHTWSHALDFCSLKSDDLEREIEQTSGALERLGGVRPWGFRAPGYAADSRVLTVCSRAGLRYDGSRLPTPWAPVLRLLARRLRAQVRREMNQAAATPVEAPGQYGGGLSLRPLWFRLGGGGAAVLRLPVAVSPTLRLPLHASLAMVLGAGAVRTGLTRLARRGWPVTYLVHGMDLLGPEDLAGRLPRALARLRPFRFTLNERLAFLTQALETMKRRTRLQTTRQWLEGQDSAFWDTEIQR